MGNIRYSQTVVLLIASVIFLCAQIIFVSPKNGQSNLDDTSILHGDSKYYLDGAKSVLEFDAYKKFNNKKQPIIAQKSVDAKDFPKYASEVAFIYPNSSFKFGYSLTVAIFTGLIPNQIFDNLISRLVFTNFILSLFSLFLILLILREFTDKLSIQISVAIFYSLDTFAINNNYLYQSHTICGIFFSLLACYTFLRFEKYNWAFLVIGNCITFSILSSSHILPFNFILAALMIGRIFIGKNRVLKKISLMLTGLSIWPLYILFVEWYLNFKALGIPTFIEQYRNYGSTIKALINTYPLTERQIWDLELWNLFIFPIIAMILLGALVSKYKFKANITEIFLTPRFLVLVLPAIGFIGITSIYSQPILRALVPNLLILDVIFGILVGILIVGTRTSLICAVLIIIMVFANYVIYTRVIIFGSGKTFWTVNELLNKKSNVSEKLRDTEAIWMNVRHYFDDPKLKIEAGKVGLYSKSLNQYVEERRSVINQTCHKRPFVVEINPTDIVEGYSHTRRYIPAFTPNPINLVSSEFIKQDFKLINELFGAANSKKVKLRHKSILYWHPSFFDQEYNYIYGYKGNIKKYLLGTELYNLDFHSLYYIDICPLIENK